jgi:Caspase domain/FG-GAP repeat
MAPDEPPAGRRRALLVATATYSDPALAGLRAPTGDVAALATVLGDAAIGGFEVEQLVDQPSEQLRRQIETFFGDGRPHDLLLFYVSGHGVLSQSRRFYFATADTSLQLLRSTAIEDSFVNDVIQSSRARSIVLILDCCHSGAFGKGLAPKSATTVDVEHRFEGRGRVTLSASTELEYAFEETAVNELEPAAPGSLFTGSVVDGLRSGDADIDEDGRISVDDLYDYVCRRVRERSVHQTPGMAGDVRGQILIARSPRRAALPAELARAVESNLAGVRAGAVDELKALLRMDGPPAAGARAALEQLADDDSRRVAAAALAALGRSPPPEAPPPAPPEAPPEAPPPAPPGAPPEAPSPAPTGRPPPAQTPLRGRWLAIAGVVAGLAALVVVGVLLLGGAEEPKATAVKPYDFQHDDNADPVLGLPKGTVAGSPATAGIVLIGATSSPEAFTDTNSAVPGDATVDDRFGAAVASGDFDRDNYADLAIGVPGKNGVSVLYGAEHRPKWIGAEDLDKKPALKDFGASLVAGDFDHNGYADLAVSAPGTPKQREDWDWSTIDILFGGRGGLSPTGGTQIAQRVDAREFGLVLATGDIDDDGNLDLVEGSPGNQSNGLGGHLSFCRGGPHGPTACRMKRESPTSALAVGRLDDDRYPDVVQGDPHFQKNAGELRVWSGGESWLDGEPEEITQDTERVEGRKTAGTLFGYDVAVGELTGDHRLDVVVSAPFDEDGGRVSVIPGSTDGPQPPTFDVDKPREIPAGAHFGIPLSLLDIDNDQLPELIVGIDDAETLDTSIVAYISHSGERIGTDPEPATGLDAVARINRYSQLVLGR